MNIRPFCICVVLLYATASQWAFATSITEPRELSSIEESERTKIFVLASPHLSVLGTDYNPDATGPLLDRLKAFAPDAIGVESLSPAAIRSMQAQGEAYAAVLQRYADRLRLGQQARDALGLSHDAAARRTAEMVRKAKRNQPYDHRALALHLVAMNDVPSAVLQWSYLDEAARRDSKDFPAEIATYLSERLASANEIYAVAVPLARRLGHVQIASIDDHSDKDLLVPIMAELEAEIRKHPEASKAGSAPLYQESLKILAAANRNGDLTPAYRRYNSAEYARLDIQTQWDIFLRTRFESGVDRVRLALWDVRNFMTAAHIRRLTTRHAGGRILVIIGAGHKPFLDSFLNQAMDVQVVPADSVLGAKP